MSDIEDTLYSSYGLTERQAHSVACFIQQILRQQQSEPFGYWHVGDTYEESDFFLASESGDVACEHCVKLYTAPPAQPVALDTTTIRAMVERLAISIDPEATLADWPEAMSFQVEMARAVIREVAKPAQSESERDAVSQVRNNYLTRTDITDSERALLIAACDDIASAMQEGKK